MSVLSCCRYGCENIMCDRYSSEHGYICDECFEELRLGGRQNIETFMESKKPRQSAQDGWEAELEAEFKSRYASTQYGDEE
jgi:hypothetical protein